MRVLNQAGEQIGAAVRTAFPDAAVVEVPIDAPVGDDVTGDVLIAARGINVGVLAHRVRWVHAVGTGIDAIPTEVFACPIVTCSRGVNAAVPIAEYVMLAMLAAEKDIDRLWIREPAVDPFATPFGGLAGRRLGLVGFGGIAREVAARALPFEMEVRAFRRSARPPDLPGVDGSNDLGEMAAWSDHLVVAVPATPATHHLVDARVLAGVGPGLHLVNVARGSLVDHEALRVALDDGRVGRATLDVTDPEPLPAGHWLYRHPRVRVSPHVSWSSPRQMDATIDYIIDNLRRWQAGEPLQGLVDRDAGY